MSLLVPLTIVTLLARGAGGLRSRVTGAPSGGWSGAVACGMAAVFVCTSLTHFLQPHRSGLVAIVPRSVPAPELAVTVSGVAEVIIAVGLVLPQTRPMAAAAAVALLIAVFPANVVAAQGVDHPHAPNTALGLRTGLQLVFLSAVGYVLGAARKSRARHHRHQIPTADRSPR